jgi:hypothetical protein
MPKPIRPIPEIDYEAFPIAVPVPRRMMHRDSRHYTVCQILREIYHEVDDPVLKMKCRIAHRMTKTMIDAITLHVPEWGKFRWPWREKPDEHSEGPEHPDPGQE